MNVALFHSGAPITHRRNNVAHQVMKLRTFRVRSII